MKFSNNLGPILFVSTLIGGFCYLRFGNKRVQEIIVMRVIKINEYEYNILDTVGNYYYINTSLFPENPIQALNILSGARLRIAVRGVKINFFKSYPEVTKIEKL